MIDLSVMSRPEAEKYVPAVPTAYVSIYTPADEPAQFLTHPHICGVLKICFDDLKDPRFQGLPLEMLDNRPAQLITDAQAMEIKNFVQACYDRGIRHFLIHCDGGISRSPGVASALDIVFNQAQLPRKEYRRRNTLVETKVLEAFKGPLVQHD